MVSSLTSTEEGDLIIQLGGQGDDRTASTLAEDDMFSQVNHINFSEASREQLFYILNGLLTRIDLLWCYSKQIGLLAL